MHLQDLQVNAASYRVPFTGLMANIEDNCNCVSVPHILRYKYDGRSAEHTFSGPMPWP